LFTAWRRFLEGLAATRRTVLVFEDLHWADDALLAFLEYLTEWSQDVPLLVLCAARPELYERRPAWGAGQRNAQTINLSPLTDTETAELVSYLTMSVVLSPAFERAVLERAGGNPLYAEEFARLLADRGVDPGRELLAESDVPDSIQALIAARLDTLPPERKSLLQDAAVIGKVFWAGALAEIAGRNEEELEQALHELARKELVRPARSSSMEAEAEYSFWHLLVRDVAYSQIPRAQRARRHRAAAMWLERKAGDRLEDLAEVLAHHYLQALDLAEASGDTAQAGELARPARRFLTLAGDRALGLDTAQAEARLARALELTPPDDPEVQSFSSVGPTPRSRLVGQATLLMHSRMLLPISATVGRQWPRQARSSSAHESRCAAVRAATSRWLPRPSASSNGTHRVLRWSRLMHSSRTHK
jgi:predicted ATPase